MSQISVQAVQTKAQRKQFLELPWKIYAENDVWVPPIRMDQKEMVGYANHPFYRANEAQTFLAQRDGQSVGRISAIINHTHNERYDEKRGFFGFFESIDDEEVSGALFDAAANWLRERGMTDMRGPCSPTQNYQCGLLIDGFDIQPTFMMPYNYPYYQNLCEGYGLEKTQDLISFWGHVDMVQSLDKKMGFVIEEAIRRFDIKLRPIRKKNFVAPDAFPYTNAMGTTMDSGAYASAMDEVMAQIDYAELRSEQERRRQDPDATLLGLG